MPEKRLTDAHASGEVVSFFLTSLLEFSLAFYFDQVEPGCIALRLFWWE
jgi:hypothetical protein